VARNNMSCSDVVGMPCARSRSTRMAYIRLELDDSNMVTWSAVVSLSFMITPIRNVSTCHDKNDLIRLVLIELQIVPQPTFVDVGSPVYTSPNSPRGLAQ